MKRENVRLDELRSMPYAEYLLTPEWQETRKAALKRAGDRCRVCRQGDVALNVYHTTFDTLGCEQEGDVIALCEVCYDLLSQRQQQAAATDSDAETPGEEPAYPHFSLAKKALIFTPTAITLDGLLALLHAPLPAELFGLGAAIALAINSPKLYAEMRDSLPAPLVEFLDGRAARKRARATAGEWNNWDRLLGRHLNEDASNDEQETAVPGDEEDTQELQGLIKLAHNLHIPLSDIAGKALFVVGMRRSGKSTLAALLAEQLGQHLLPMLIPDFEGDLLSLAEVLPRALIMHGPITDIKKYQNERQRVLTMEVSVRTAPQWGYTIFEKGYQVLLDLSSYTTLEEAIAIQIALIRGMFTWANEHPDKRTTSLVYLDEAQRYLPENLKDSVIQDKALIGELLRAYSDIVAIGGKRGIAPVIITQRMAQVNKKIVNQSEVFFVLRQTSDNDLDRVMDYVNKDTATRQQISTFAQGQGVYIAFDGTQLLTRFDQRVSSGKRSETPDAQAAQRYAYVPMEMSANHLLAQPLQNQPTTAPTVRSEQVVRQQAEQEPTLYQPTYANREFAEQERGLQPAAPESARPHLALVREETQVRCRTEAPHRIAGIPPELREAAQAYRPGMTFHDLGRALHCSSAEARILWQELRKYHRVLERQASSYQLVANGGQVPSYQEAVEPRSTVPGSRALSHPAANEREGRKIQLGKDVFLTQQQFAFALKLRKTGMSTGYRDLMPVFDLSEHHAKELNKQIRATLGQAPECESE